MMVNDRRYRTDAWSDSPEIAKDAFLIVSSVCFLVVWLFIVTQIGWTYGLLLGWGPALIVSVAVVMMGPVLTCLAVGYALLLILSSVL